MSAISTHIRSHAVGYVALFIALGGTAWALQANSVKSKHIKDGQVKTADLAGGAVTGTKVLDDSLTGDDIDESELDISGRSASGSCDVDESDFEDCATQTIDLEHSARVLLVANAGAYAFQLDDPDDPFDPADSVEGSCRFVVDGSEQQGSQSAQLHGELDRVGVSSTMVTNVLDAGAHTFIWRCYEELDGDIRFQQTQLSAIALPAT